MRTSARPPLLRPAAFLVTAALVFSGCSDDEEPESTGPADDTPADTDTEGTPDADAPGRESTTVETSDGETLAVEVFNGGQPTVVVLGHMRGTGKETWFDFADEVAAAGHTAVAFDFRGYGDSTGEIDTDLDVDLAALVGWAGDEGAERVFVFGASMGGTATVATGATADLAGIASLSGPATFAGIDAASVAADVDEPFLAITARDDQPYADAATAFADDAPNATLHEFDGRAHGTRLFDEHGDELSQILLDFIG